MTRTDMPPCHFSRMLALALVALVLFAVALPAHAREPVQRVSYAGCSVVQAVATSEEQLGRLLEICPRVFSCHLGVGAVDVIADKRQQRQLRDAGIAFTVRIADLGPILEQERARLEAAAQGGIAGGSFFDDYKPYASVMSRLDALAAAHPTRAQVFTVGFSEEGRAIKGLRISGSATTKPAVLITACQHAREWITPMTAMFICETLLNSYGSDAQITQLVDSLEFLVVPIMNPDGYVYTWGPDRFWRKNRQPNFDGSFGVDLNRNWAIGFGGPNTSSTPTSEVYPGIKPFSAPETFALSSFTVARPNIIAALDLHSYAQIVLQPWSYTNDRPPAYACIDEIGGKLTQCIHDVHGEHYPHASGNGVIYLAGGTIHDWMFGDQGVLAYTIELRPKTFDPGFVLPPQEIIPTGEEIVPAVLTLAETARRPVYLAFEKGGPPAFVQADEPTTVHVAMLSLTAGTLSTAKLFARAGSAGPFTASPLTWDGDSNYIVTLPAAPCGADLQFYFEVQSSTLGTRRIPEDAPATVFHSAVRDITVAFHDNMETNTGWTVGAPGDNANTGIWTRGAPALTTNTSGVPAQPGFDNPDGEGAMCWYTGAEPGPFAGANDVDGGVTTLTSPVLNAVGEGDPYISYARWYSNNTGTDPATESMPVEISNNGGQTWTLLELVEFNETKWVTKSFRIADFVTPTNAIRVRFVARDLPPLNSVVEAAVDDLRLTFVGCDNSPCPGDIVSSVTFQPPGDGSVDAADLAYLLGAWGVNPGSPADQVSSGTFQPPPDGVVDGADLSTLLGAWGACR